MPLETATHISDLIVTNPAASDGLNQADDHMRLIKGVLLNDIGDAMTGKALTLPDGTSSAPIVGFKADATVGFYRKATGVIGLVGKLFNPATVGALHMFLVEPTGLGKGGTGTGWTYLELDGSTWPNSAFPELATHLGQGGTSFTLPNAYATGTFPRSRRSGVTAGTIEANQNKAHTHAVTGNTGIQSADHSHSFSGTTGGMNANNPHSHSATTNTFSFNAGTGSFGINGNTTATTTGNTDINHGHSFSGTTSGVSANHTHAISLTSAGGSADGAEARPEALSVVLCIKT